MRHDSKRKYLTGLPSRAAGVGAKMDLQRLISVTPFGERYFGEGTGKDWFGVSWTYIPEMFSQTETPGQEVLEELEDWQEKVKFPDLDAYDWQALAAEATKNWDRENKVSLCMLLNGPFERMMSLMALKMRPARSMRRRMKYIRLWRR